MGGCVRCGWWVGVVGVCRGRDFEPTFFSIVNDICYLSHLFHSLPPHAHHTHSSNSRSLRPGSMRLGRARPPSAREQRAAPTSNATNLPTRAFSVSVRPDSAGAPRPYATYSPSSTSTTRFRHPLPAELMNIQHSADFGDCKHSSHTYLPRAMTYK